MFSSPGIIQSKSKIDFNPGNIPGEFINSSLFTDANLLGYWRMEDYRDWSNNNNPLTSGFATPNFTTGKYNNGVDLGNPNISKGLRTTNTLGISGTGAITICGWVFFNTLGAGGSPVNPVFEYIDATTGKYLSMYWNVGPVLWSFDNSGNANNPAIGVTSGNWYHIGITRSSTAPNAANLYINGSVVDTLSEGAVTTTPTGLLFLGYDGGTNYTSAIYDEVVVFSRELNSTEINNIMNGV